MTSSSDLPQERSPQRFQVPGVCPSEGQTRNKIRNTPFGCLLILFIHRHHEIPQSGIRYTLDYQRPSNAGKVHYKTIVTNM